MQRLALGDGGEAMAKGAVCPAEQVALGSQAGCRH